MAPPKSLPENSLQPVEDSAPSFFRAEFKSSLSSPPVELTTRPGVQLAVVPAEDEDEAPFDSGARGMAEVHESSEKPEPPDAYISEEEAAEIQAREDAQAEEHQRQNTRCAGQQRKTRSPRF